MSDELIPSINVSTTDNKSRELAQEILNTEDFDKVKDLTALFNMNTKKRNVVRVLKMTELLDNVTDKVIDRFNKTPDNFTNEDLLKYMQVTEASIEKANKNLDMVEEAPAIQLNQNNQVNINIGETLTRDSRERINDAVQSIIKKLQHNDNVIDVDNIEEIEDG